MLIVIFAECVHFWGSKILLRCLWNWLWVVLYKRYMFTVALLWDWCRYAFVLCCAVLICSTLTILSQFTLIECFYCLRAIAGVQSQSWDPLWLLLIQVFPNAPNPVASLIPAIVCVLMNRPNWIKDSSRCEFTMSQDSVSK